ASMIGRWFTRTDEQTDAPEENEAASSGLLAELGAEILGTPTDPKSRNSDRLEYADMAMPTTLIVVSAAAYRLRPLVTKWWRRPTGRPDTRIRQPAHRPWSGRHFSRATLSSTTLVRAAGK